MSTITKEWLQQKIADMEAARDEIPFGLDEDDSYTLAALRIALASIEAEPVAWRYRFVHTPKSEEHGSPFTTDWVLTHCEDDCNPSDCFERQPLYTAPPAPVSIPDEWRQWIADAVEYLEGGLEADGELEAEGSIDAKRLLSRRDAMLQGAERVTTDYKLRDAVDAIRNSGIAIDAEKILAERDALNSPVIPDGWVLVPMEPTEEMCDVGHVGVDVLTGVTDENEYYSIDGENAAKVYRAMIAAAPQQEVKP